MKRSFIAVLGLGGALGLLLPACGGSQTGSEAPSGSDSSGDWDGSGRGSAEPVGPDCSDGTCFSCGEGVCPAGAYCDDAADGGAACAWLSECAGETSCACFTQVLGSSCSCTDSDGGPSISCP